MSAEAIASACCAHSATLTRLHNSRVSTCRLCARSISQRLAVLEPQGASTAKRCEIERAQRRQVLTRELCNLVSVAECAQHAEAIASADIGCYRKRHPRGIGGSYVK